MAEREGLFRKVQLYLDAQSAMRVEREVRKALEEGTDPREAVRNLREVEKGTGRLERWFKRLGGTIVAAFAIERIRAFSAEMFNLGTAAEETASKFETTFGRSQQQVQSFLDQWARLAGLNRTVGQEMSATAGAIVQGMGASEEASAAFSERMLRLAGDLQSFHNVPIEETFAAIKSGLVGSWEPLDRFGIVLRQADVDQRALIETGKAHVSQLTQLDKAVAALSLMYERAGPALGDLERTQDSTANSARQLQADFENIRIEMAQELMPVFAEVVGSLSENKDSIKEAALTATEVLVGLLEALGRIASFTASAIEVVIDVKTKVNGIEQDLREYFNSIPFIRRINERLLANANLTPEERARFRAQGFNVPEPPAPTLPAVHAGPPQPGGVTIGEVTPVRIEPTPRAPEEVRRLVDEMLEEAERRRNANRGVFAPEHIEGIRDASGRIVRRGRTGRAEPSMPDIIQDVGEVPAATVRIVPEEWGAFQQFFETLRLSAEDTAWAMTDAYQGFFETLFAGLEEGEDLFGSMAEAAEGVGRSIIASMTEGAAQWQMAEGMADLAGGSWPPNPAQLAAASLHFAAAGAFRALSAIIGGAGRSFVPSGSAAPSAGAPIAQQATETPIKILVTARGILAGDDPVVARQVGELMDLNVHLAGTPAWARS